MKILGDAERIGGDETLKGDLNCFTLLLKKMFFDLYFRNIVYVLHSRFLGKNFKAEFSILILNERPR